MYSYPCLIVFGFAETKNFSFLRYSFFVPGIKSHFKNVWLLFLVKYSSVSLASSIATVFFSLSCFAFFVMKGYVFSF